MRAGYFSAGILLMGGLLTLYLFDPLRSSLYPPCPFHYLTDLYCPGCGSLRALHRLLNGNISGALAMNPLMVISLPFIAALLLRPRWSYRRWLPWTCLAVLLIYVLLRNINAWPFVLLAPA